MPAALAYEASQMVAAGYQPEKVEDCTRPGILEQLTSFIANFMEKPQPAQPQTLCNEQGKPPFDLPKHTTAVNYAYR